MKRLKALFTKALDELAPYRLTQDALKQLMSDHNNESMETANIYLISTGKAAIEMTKAVVDMLGDRLNKGIVITSYEFEDEFPNIEIFKGSHPVPDEKSVQASGKVVEFVKSIPENSSVIYTLSGGTSALFELPAEGIRIDELSEAYKLLNNSGASISEINTVRKHLSQIKGGQLLRYFDPYISLVDLIISDVPGDDPSVIGSGPTTPDLSTFQDAYHILLEYELWNRVSSSIRKHIEKGIDGIVHDLTRPGEDPLSQHRHQIIGSAGKLAEKVKELAEKDGLHVIVANEAYNKEVTDVAKSIAYKAVSIAVENPSPPVLLIRYGEGRVEVTGRGKGGRNQELALSAALEIDGYSNITWLSAGTDGIDGPTDAAGAIVDGNTVRKAGEMGLDPKKYLDNNDSYHFHDKVGTLLKTGPTGNNVMDLQLVLIE